MFKYLLAKNEDIPTGSAAVYFGFSAIVWFVIGTGLGAFNAAKLAFPDFVYGLEFVSFGHMRQVHVHAVIFGWICTAFAMHMMYITPVLGNSKLWSEKLGLWNCFLWNIGLSLGLTVLWAGMTSGREYSDFPWFIDLYIALFMAIPLGINVWMTIIKRRTQGIYATNWFFAAASFMLIIVFIVGNLPQYFHLTGLTEAYLTWWFAHNVHIVCEPPGQVGLGQPGQVEVLRQIADYENDNQHETGCSEEPIGGVDPLRAALDDGHPDIDTERDRDEQRNVDVDEPGEIGVLAPRAHASPEHRQ